MTLNVQPYRNLHLQQRLPRLPRLTVPGRSRAGVLAEAGGTESADITGQQAIDQLTSEITGKSVRVYNTSGDLSETGELHFCAGGLVRYYHHQSYSGLGPMATEKFGQPWTVVEALVRGDGSYGGARVQVTFTYQNALRSGSQQIHEPFETRIEHQNGEWYWAGVPVVPGQASCEPTL